MIRDLVIFVTSFLLLGCNVTKVPEGVDHYRSETLVIQKVADNVYQHTSFLETKSFGRVSCNGMIVFDKNEAVIFDTPTNGSTSIELINWVEKKLNCKVKAIIPTHFHVDCLGGLGKFHERNIQSYAHDLTIELASSKKAIAPHNSFSDSLELRVGNKKIIAQFIGEGHTKDNIIGYFPDQQVMFGGCLIKGLGAGKGNLEDANTHDWPSTVAKLKERYPNINVVIPGHGELGGAELLDYTITLFE